MTHTFSADIRLPVGKAVELFSDYDNLRHWQTELKSYEPLSGVHLQPGTKTKLNYRSVTMVETIIENKLPLAITAEYDHMHGSKTVMRHRATNRFISLDQNNTRFESEMEFLEAIGFMPRLMMKLMGGVFRKFYAAQVKRFGTFAEREAGK